MCIHISHLSRFSSSHDFCVLGTNPSTQDCNESESIKCHSPILLYIHLTHLSRFSSSHDFYVLGTKTLVHRTGTKVRV